MLDVDKLERIANAAISADNAFESTGEQRPAETLSGDDLLQIALELRELRGIEQLSAKIVSNDGYVSRGDLHDLHHRLDAIAAIREEFEDYLDALRARQQKGTS